MDFEQNSLRLTSNKYHIWNQHKKLSRPMYISNCFDDFCFLVKFLAIGIRTLRGTTAKNLTEKQKLNFDKTQNKPMKNNQG
jgi:hypothetical protein